MNLLDQNIQKLETKILELNSRANEKIDPLISEGRNFTPAEKEAFDQITEQVRSERDKLAELRKVRDVENEVGGFEREFIGNVTTDADTELAARFRKSIQNRSLEPIEIQQPKSEMRSGFQPGIEKRALSISGAAAPGLRGTSFFGTLQRHLVENSQILNAGATVLQTDTGEPYVVPKSTAFSTATIVAEGAIIPMSDPTLSGVTLGAYKYGFLVQVSTELANDVNFDLISFLAEQAGIALGNGFGAHSINGTGTAQPTGILTGATVGVTGPTGTATSFGLQTTTGQGGDLLLDLVASLAEPYARSASAGWLMRNATLNVIRKLRDSTGRYVFDDAVIPGSGSAGTLLGRPVFLDPNMPAVGANAKSILFGDMSRYWVRQVSSLRFEGSIDFAFDRDMVTYRGLARLDGATIDFSAVKYFQHSAT